MEERAEGLRKIVQRAWIVTSRPIGYERTFSSNGMQTFFFSPAEAVLARVWVRCLALFALAREEDDEEIPDGACAHPPIPTGCILLLL